MGAIALFKASPAFLVNLMTAETMAKITETLSALSLSFGSSGWVSFAAAIVLIEGRSVWENERAKKGNVAKLPAAIRDIINCTTAKSAEELLKKIKELDDGQKAT